MIETMLVIAAVGAALIALILKLGRRSLKRQPTGCATCACRPDLIRAKNLKSKPAN